MKNRMLKEKRLGIAILVVTLAALLLFTACAPTPPSEEKQVVKIGAILPFTGAGANPMQGGWRNMEDYHQYFEEVGIPGHNLPPGVTFQIVWADSGMEATRAISAYERMRQSVVFFHVASPNDAHPLRSRLEKDGIAAMTLSVDEALMYPPGWFFGVYPTESERFAAVCDWIMENWKEEGPPRVAFMGSDTVNGRAPEVMGTAYAESIGIEMLPFESIPHMPLDTTPQLLRLRDEGADYVYITTLWTAAIAVVKDAERLGLLDEMRFGAGLEAGLAIPLVEALGPLAEGYFGAISFPWYTETPILYDILRTIDGRLDTTGSSSSTVQFCSAPIEAIRIAIEEVGYENLDGRAVKEAMYSITDWDPYKIGRPVTYTREDHRGEPELRVYEVQGEEVVPVTDWRDAPMLVP
jgi:ABC-type branched-subunit amino acid transport system substrate-binding protein